MIKNSATSNEYKIIAYDTINFELKENKYNQIPVQTVFNGDLSIINEKSEFNQNFNKESKVLDGVVLNIFEDIIKVKLNNDYYVNFPKVIFSKIKDLKVGQHFKYSIKFDDYGFKYQEIIPYNITNPHPKKEKILKMLDEIKLKDD